MRGSDFPVRYRGGAAVPEGHDGRAGALQRLWKCRTQCAVVVGFGLVLAGPVRAERIPTPGALDARVRSVPYEADQVVRLQGQVGYALELVFESGEAFAGLASGDLTGVDFTAQGEHLFLKPKAAGVATNLTVLTDRRVYRFAYVITDGSPADRSSLSVRSHAPAGAVPSALPSGEVLHAVVPSAGLPPAGVVWSVRFVYPPRAVADATAPATPAILNERYQFCGARQLKPRRVFDDGVRTTLEFDAHQELPAVFVRNPDGSESLVNFSVEGAGLIVHRVVEHLILRRGSLTACLRNRGPAGGSSTDKGPPGAAHRNSLDQEQPLVGGAAHGGPADGTSSEKDRPAAGADGASTANPTGGGSVDREVPHAVLPPAGTGGER